MRKTRLTALSSLAVLLVLPSLASANCYSIYDAKNRLAFQSTIAPVDLSTRISDGMRARFPGGHLIMVPDDSDCRECRDERRGPPSRKPDYVFGPDLRYLLLPALVCGHRDHL